MSDFNFKQNETNVTKYEYVKFIKATPKNPQDFHEMENILRHRQNSIVREMYGNCRVGSTAEETFQIISGTPKTLQIRNGVWYVDGYRIYIDSSVAIENFSTGYIVAKIKFIEIPYTVDPTIAIQDPNTNKLIETSSRIKLVCDLSYVENVIEDPTYEATVSLLKITSALSSSPVIEEQFTYINIKYAEAINIVNKSVHKEDDDKTVEIVKLTTSVDSDGAPRIIIEDSDNAKSISLFRSHEINSSMAAFELINVQGRWYPTLWMKSDLDEYPLCYITPDNIKLDNGSGSILDMTYDQISVGNPSSNLLLGSFGVSYRYLNKTGFELYPYFSNGAYKYTVVGIDAVKTTASISSGDNSYNNWRAIRYGNVTTKAVYQFTVPSADKPTDGYIYLNHMIKSDTSSIERIITARIYTSVGEIENTIFIKKYKLSGRQSATIEPLKIYIGDIAVNTTVNIEYTCAPTDIKNFEEDFYTYVGILALNESSFSYPCFWYVFSENDIIFSTTMDVIRIGDHLLHIDKDSRVKIKKITENNYSQELATFKNTDPVISGEYTEPGGKQINISNLSVNTFEANWGGEQPRYDINNSTLRLPKLSKDPTNAAEIPVMPTLDYMSHIWATITNTSNNLQPFLPQNVYYVSSSWTKYGGEINNTPNIFPFYRTIDAAINAIKTNATKTGTIVLHPGYHYIEGQNMDGVYDISGCTITIVSTDPKNSIIVGGFADTTSSANLYIDTSMKTGSSTPNVGFFTKSFISFTQSTSKVICGKNCFMVHNDNFPVSKLIEIRGASSFEFYGSITYTRSSWELTSATITNTSYLIYIQDTEAKKKLTNIIIDGEIYSNNRYHCIYVETFADSANIKIDGNISIQNRHMIATIDPNYTIANSNESTKGDAAIKVITRGNFSVVNISSDILTQTYDRLLHVNQYSSVNSRFVISGNITNYFKDIDGYSVTGDAIYGARSAGNHLVFIENSNGLIDSNIYSESHYGAMHIYGVSNVDFIGKLEHRGDNFYNAANTSTCGVFLATDSCKLNINNAIIDHNPKSTISNDWVNARTLILHSAKVFINNSVIKGVTPISVTHGAVDNFNTVILNNSKIVLRNVSDTYYSITKVDSGSPATHFFATHCTANKMSDLINANALVSGTSDINYFLTNGAINE